MDILTSHLSFANRHLECLNEDEGESENNERGEGGAEITANPAILMTTATGCCFRCRAALPTNQAKGNLLIAWTTSLLWCQ